MNIETFNYFPKINNYKLNNTNTITNKYKLAPLSCDSFSFKGAQAYQYDSTFSYMASRIIASEQQRESSTNKTNGVTYTKYNIQPKYIKDSVKSIIEQDEFYNHINSVLEKNTFVDYYTPSLKEEIISGINTSRNNIFEEWESILKEKNTDIPDSLAQKLKDPITKFIVWKGINYGINEDNRHIPVSFNPDILEKTIDYFMDPESIPPKERNTKAGSIAYFSEVYNSMSIDSLIDDIIKNSKYTEYKLYDPQTGKEIDKSSINSAKDLDELWIKIPKGKKKTNWEDAISAVEILSNENWCTKSRANKAKCALQDGSFYVYIKKEKSSSGYNKWTPEIGMATELGEISQIQGPLNNYFIPLDKLDTVCTFIKENTLRTKKEYNAEGPKAGLQILIAKRLKQIKSNKNSLNLKTLFSILYPEKIKETNNDNYGLTLKNLRSFRVTLSQGNTVPLGFLGYKEDDFTPLISEIEGNFDMRKLNLSKFPSNLKYVGNSITCTNEQYSKYKDDIDKVIPNSEIQHKDSYTKILNKTTK